MYYAENEESIFLTPVDIPEQFQPLKNPWQNWELAN